MALVLEKSETGILNAALMLILPHANRATDAVSDTSSNAQKFRDLYPMARESVLRENDWNFASRRKSLVELDDAPEWGFDHQYLLPADYVAIREVEGATNVATYSIENHPSGLVICSNLGSPLNIRYTRSEDNLAYWDASALDALAKRVAADMAPSLTGKGVPDAAQAAQIAANKLDIAKERDSQEGTNNNSMPRGDWVDSRWE